MAHRADGRDRTVQSIAQELNVSSAHLHRLFKKCFNTTPKSFAASLPDAVQFSADFVSTPSRFEPLLQDTRNTFLCQEDLSTLELGCVVECAGEYTDPSLFNGLDEPSDL